jgi:hypothetical protein
VHETVLEMNMKFKELFVLHLFMKLAKSDKYVYADYYEISKLQNFGLNPNNPIDAFRILMKNDNHVQPVNFLGALCGIWQILENFKLSIEDLLSLEEPNQSNVKKSLTPKELEILQKVKDLSELNVDPNCQNIVTYAETNDKTLKCKLKTENLGCYKTEYLHNTKPKIVLVHDFDSSQKRSKWMEKIENSETFHMKSLYGDEIESE